MDLPRRGDLITSIRFGSSELEIACSNSACGFTYIWAKSRPKKKTYHMFKIRSFRMKRSEEEIMKVEGEEILMPAIFEAREMASYKL